jgi:hypothetical protein
MLTDGNAEISGPNRTAWTRLASRRALAATAAGRRCGLRSLTAAGYTPSGLPLLAGTCSRPGTAGIFAASNRTWQAAGPLMPAALARQQITVLRLASSANDIVVLLAAGSGHATRLLAAWSAGGSGRWSLSPPLQPGGAALASASFGPGGTVAVVTTANRGAVITGAGGHWRALPALPPGTVTLAPGTGSQIEALAVHRATLTVWQLPSGGRRWAPRQVISVPIQFGSSG